jgi:hypothetical protein
MAASKITKGLMITIPIAAAAIPWVNKGIRNSTDVGGRIFFSVLFAVGGAIVAGGLGMGIMWAGNKMKSDKK